MSLEQRERDDDDDVKAYSCLICRQRKIKCDRRAPCFNCVKAEKHCSFTPPVRGKRKRTKLPKEGLHSKLRRYEALLKSYGANLEPSEALDDTDLETTSEHGSQAIEARTAQATSTNGLTPSEEDKPKLIRSGGGTRYFDSTLWSLYNLGDEFKQGVVENAGGPTDQPNTDENIMFFEADHAAIRNDLTTFLPAAQTLPKLKQAYIDRVDPVVKILHLPTFWPILSSALQQPKEMPKDVEAVIFAFLLASLSSLDDDECQSLFKTSRSLMFIRFRSASRQALMNADYLSTTSVTTLRAFAMFTKAAVRNNYRVDTLFVLSGIAIRLARKMGLHRDGSSLGLSPFDTEMRRRLWWHLVHVDYRMADLLGTKPSMDLTCHDTESPLNVNDEDLQPDMVSFPPDRKGITSIVICSIRCEIVKSLKHIPAMPQNDMRWEMLAKSGMSVGKMDTVISVIEDHLEKKYVRYCDPSNSLHAFVSVMVRASICKMKILAHNTRRYTNEAIKPPQHERDIIFANAKKLLEYSGLLKNSHFCFEKFLWLNGSIYLWNTVLYVLIEIRHRKTGPDVDRAWQLIGMVISQHSQIFANIAKPVYAAITKWTLEVWDEHVTALIAEGLQTPETPIFVEAMRYSRASLPSDSNDRTSGKARPATQQSYSEEGSSWKHQEDFPNIDPVVNFEFPDILSLESDPNEWAQWEHLIADQNGFA